MKTITVKLAVSDEVANSLSKQNCKDSFTSELVERELTRIVELGHGFKFDLMDKRLFNKKRDIKLTPIELKLFEVLLRNHGEITTIETIHDVAWSGKNMTRFTLRNKIKTLRDKTYYKIIKNHSNIGYSFEGVK